MISTQPFVSNAPAGSKQKLRVLMAESDPARITKLLHSLFPDEDSLEITPVSTISILLPTIQLLGPEIVFLDLSLCGADPLTTVRAVHRGAPNLPLITLAETAQKELAEKTLKEGALDFLLTDVAESRTVERVLRAALERNTVAGLADLLRDKDTGLYNGDGFRALTSKYALAAQRTKGQLMLLAIRIENLEELEKEFGPTNGTSAIRQTAELLKGSFRRTDLVARLKGGTFAVVAADAAEPSAAIIRQRLETRRVALNRVREPWGPVELKFDVAFWSAGQAKPFSAIVESLLGDCAERDTSLMAVKDGVS